MDSFSCFGGAMPLVERNEELGRLRSLLDGCVEGRGAVAMLTGAVGSGKTRLLNTFANDVAASGGLLLRATGSRAEQEVPLGLVTQLILTATPADAPPDDRIESLLHEPVESGRPAGAREVRLFMALASTLVELARGRPLVIAVDDLQYVDELSLRWLLFVIRRGWSMPTLVVLGDRNTPTLTPGWFRAELASQATFHRIQLGLLSPEGVADLLAAEFDEATADRLTTSCHELSGGNRTLLNALIDDLRAAGRQLPIQQSTHPPVGDAYRDAVSACVHRHEPEVLKAACALAVLDEEATPALLAAMLGVRPEQARRMIDTLAASGLVRDCRLPHPVAREAVLAEVPVEVRPALHRQAAELLLDEGAPLTSVAGHLVAADDASAPWAVSVLCRAADQALAHDDVELVSQFLELARRFCHDEQERTRIAATLAHVAWRVNRARVDRQLTHLTGAMRAGHLHADDAIASISYLLWHGRLDEAYSALTQMGDLADEVDDNSVSNLDAFRLWVGTSYPPLLSAFPSKPSPPPAGVGDDIRMRAAVAFSTVLRDGPQHDMVTLAEQVLETCRLDHSTLEAVRMALLTLVYADRMDKAVPWCETLTSAVARRQAPTWQATLDAIAADIAVRRGDLPAAERLARSALTSMSERSWGVAIGNPLSTLLYAVTAMGRYDEAATLLERPVPATLFHTRWGLSYLHARAFHYLSTDRPQAALTDITMCGELMVAWNMDLPALVPWRSEAARIHLRLGHDQRARQLAEKQLSRPGTRTGRTHGISLRVLAAARELKHRPQLLRKSADELRQSGDHFELARTLTDLGAAHHALGESDRARMLVRRAWQIAKKCRAESLRPGLSADWLEDTTEPPQPEEDTENGDGETLSYAERRVASLAASGHTNREIARKLFVTVSTVEQHLTHAYRKLDVRRRTELPVKLSALPAEDDTNSDVPTE